VSTPEDASEQRSRIETYASSWMANARRANELLVDRWGEGLTGAGAIWLLTRVLTVSAAVALALAGGRSVSGIWHHWDSGWFLNIAEHGYSDDRQSAAFFPLYPALLYLGGLVLGGHRVLAGFLISFPLTFASFALLYVFARDHTGGRSAAKRAVWYLALFPYAFFLQVVYSEALFLVCALAAFVAAERRRFLPAGLLAGAAMLTRPSGVAVLAGLVALALGESARWSALARLAVAPLLFCIFPLVLVLEGRGPLAFIHAEGRWREFAVLAVPHSVYDGARAAWNGVVDLAGGATTLDLSLHSVTAFAALVVFAVLSAVGWRRLGSPSGVYCAVSLLMPLAARSEGWPLTSFQRFVLVLFPCFVVLGALPLGRYGHRALLAAGAVGLTGLLYLWVGGHFVA
jgi:mannosyltransferase PIG-V